MPTDKGKKMSEVCATSESHGEVGTKQLPPVIQARLLESQAQGIARDLYDRLKPNDRRDFVRMMKLFGAERAMTSVAFERIQEGVMNLNSQVDAEIGFGRPRLTA